MASESAYSTVYFFLEPAHWQAPPLIWAGAQIRQKMSSLMRPPTRSRCVPLRMLLVAAAFLLVAACSLVGATRPVNCAATGYQNLLRSGDQFASGTWGMQKGQDDDDLWRLLPATSDAYPPAPFDAGGASVPPADGAYKKFKQWSISPDIPTLHVLGPMIMMVNHFEYGQPSNPYKSEIKLDRSTGKMSVVNTEAIIGKDVGGFWFMCSGTTTPWKTHLASEEYPADCRLYEQAMLSPTCDATTASFSACGWAKLNGGDAVGAMGMARFFGAYPVSPEFVDVNINSPEVIEYEKTLGFGNQERLDRFRNNFKCYNYGSVPEIKILASGNHQVTKWRTIGRVSFEQALVMPDERTVYATDDGTNCGFFMFKADKQRNFNSGTLYAAKLTELTGKTDEWTVSWIELGKGTQAGLEALIKSNIKFSEIFEVGTPIAETWSCPEGFSATNNPGSSSYKVGSPAVYLECLKVKPGMEVAAAFLESRRYAAMKGATVEFEKEEGITFSKDRMEMYVSYTRFEKGMTTDKLYSGASKDLNMAVNKCGGVFKYKLQKDWSASAAKVLVQGTPLAAPDADGNRCHLDGISSPDNLYHINDILFIAEDTSMHLNNVLWAFDLEKGTTTRILSSPKYAEVTGINFALLDKYSYFMLAMQHPEQAQEVDALNKAQADKERGYVGYIGPLDTQKLRTGFKPVFAGIPVPTGADQSKVMATNQICYERMDITHKW